MCVRYRHLNSCSSPSPSPSPFSSVGAVGCSFVSSLSTPIKVFSSRDSTGVSVSDPESNPLRKSSPNARMGDCSNSSTIPLNRLVRRGAVDVVGDTGGMVLNPSDLSRANMSRAMSTVSFPVLFASTGEARSSVSGVTVLLTLGRARRALRPTGPPLRNCSSRLSSAADSSAS
ncbi:hypothetical protein BXZ70DRAFT_753306 [Cristinia sonorae]|uniref:Uncharacterized protein n=1 Tax=Cristinia sonorae TaxID=1940300 RepID=A0A8K0UTC7_9AGAR|nr:hypothetical protein BXZ70DRAFT_753306 [Cristinia sonorae]